MNHTTNYNLNQWEAQDKVQRVDFNADNAKIDAALKAQADSASALSSQVALKASQVEMDQAAAAITALQDRTGLHTIKSIAIAPDVSQFNIPMGDISWSSWKIVATIVKVNMTTGSCVFYPMGTDHDASDLAITNSLLIVQFPLGTGSFPFAGFLTSKNGWFNFGVPFQSAQGFRVVPSSSGRVTGGSITILGIK